MSSPSTLDNTFHCGKCARMLSLKKCANRRHAEQYYVACFSSTHVEPFYHFFPRGQTPVPETAARLMAMADLRPCRTLHCKIKRISKLCDSRKCKQHCIESGGCRLHSPIHVPEKPEEPSKLKKTMTTPSLSNMLYPEMKARGLLRIAPSRRPSLPACTLCNALIASRLSPRSPIPSSSRNVHRPTRPTTTTRPAYSLFLGFEPHTRPDPSDSQLQELATDLAPLAAEHLPS
ncbi:hypothetical protein B0H17DRAFT_1125130 [Mycena rosella]|uniref:C2H2-type domain-containing protein n=1 Tax=Mycena rosella TaxID=1033263 RepID=A0AAD7GX73_MYCRO|nr:hypothetical protein B0H17DRAFT_1125130 [Mycena rosella]